MKALDKKLFRDLWLYREGILLAGNVESAARGLCAPLPEEDFLFLRTLEKEARKEEDYLEALKGLSDERALRIVAALESLIPSA